MVGGGVCVFLICSSLYSSVDKLLQNSRPVSDVISRGRPNLHIHLSKSTLVTFRAVLSSTAASSAYFENASVMTIMYFLPVLVVLRGPNKSM